MIRAPPLLTRPRAAVKLPRMIKPLSTAAALAALGLAAALAGCGSGSDAHATATSAATRAAAATTTATATATATATSSPKPVSADDSADPSTHKGKVGSTLTLAGSGLH